MLTESRSVYAPLSLALTGPGLFRVTPLARTPVRRLLTFRLPTSLQIQPPGNATLLSSGALDSGHNPITTP